MRTSWGSRVCWLIFFLNTCFSYDDTCESCWAGFVPYCHCMGAVWDLTLTTIKGNMQRVCSEAKTLPDTHQHTPLYTPRCIEGRWWKYPKWSETESVRNNRTIHHLDKSLNWFHETSPLTSIQVKLNCNTILCDGCVSVCLLHWCCCCVLCCVNFCVLCFQCVRLRSTTSHRLQTTKATTTPPSITVSLVSYNQKHSPLTCVYQT